MFDPVKNRSIFYPSPMLKELICRSSLHIFLLFLCLSILLLSGHANSWEEEEEEEGESVGAWWPPLVKREDRRSLVSTEYGKISEIQFLGSNLQVQFFTMEPNCLFLPVILNADMVFFVETGSGKLSWTEENDLKNTDLTQGDVYRLQPGTVFFVRSNLETDTQRQKLRIHAIFAHLKDDLIELATGPYSSIRDMLLGFDRKVLQTTLNVSEEVIDELLNGKKTPAIIHGVLKSKRKAWGMEARFITGLIGSKGYNIFQVNNKRKEKVKLFNLFKEKKDFENSNGWSTTVTGKKLSALKGTDISLFMVNLTRGSMMGPHWNPMATEIAVVLKGQGIVRFVCSSTSNETECRNARFKVEEGDVFTVPRFHPMAQMAFNNDTFVFVGFSTSVKRNHPQFFAGQASVFQTIDKEVLSISFNVTNTTLDQILASQKDSVILGCTSCAEEELRMMEEEAREREEKEAKKREEEKRREEEEARKREEEEARREEEERKKREKEEEEKRREEEKRKEEEEAARREEEEGKKREEEEEAKRREEEKRKEEEEAARREEEERKRQEEEEEEEARRREEEKRKEDEEAARREEEARRREEEVVRREEAERKRQEEARRREGEAARREEEERKRREEAEQEEARRTEEEERKKREEEEAERIEEEEARKREEAARRKEEERKIQEEEEARRFEEEEEARKREEEERKKWKEEEAAAATRRKEGEKGAKKSEEEIEKEKQAEEARQREKEEEAGRREREQEEAEQWKKGEEQAWRSEEERAVEEEREWQEEVQREEEAFRKHEKEREEERAAEEEREWQEELQREEEAFRKHEKERDIKEAEVTEESI